MPLPLTSQEALKLTASFAFAADRMRLADAGLQAQAKIYETASRVAFLRAHLIAKQEETVSFRGCEYRRTVFTIA